MDMYDIGALALLVGYGMGYIHSNLVKKSIKKSAEEWLVEAVAQVATFGVTLMNENESEDRFINCVATVDGSKVSVVITELESK